MSSNAKFSAAVTFLNASHAAFLAHGLARTSKATRKLFSDTVAHAATMTGEEGGLSLEENTCDVIRMACVMGDHTKVAHRVSYVEPEAPASVEPEAETFTLLDRPGLAFRTVRRYMAAEVIPSVEGLSICGGFTTCARVEDVRFLTGPDAAPVAPVQSAPEPLEAFPNAEQASMALIGAGFQPTPMTSAYLRHPDGRTACIVKHAFDEGRFVVKHIPAPAPVAMVAQPVQQQQAKHTPGPWKVWEPDGVFVQSAERDICIMAPTSQDLTDSTAEDTANANLIAAAPDMLAALETALEAWRDQFEPSDDAAESDLHISGADFLDWFTQWRETAVAAVAAAKVKPAPVMVPLPVQQAQSRDMRAAPAPVEPVDGLTDLLARIEAVTGPRVVLATPRAAPEAAPDVVMFDGPDYAFWIAACCGLMATCAAYLMIAAIAA